MGRVQGHFATGLPAVVWLVAGASLASSCTADDDPAKSVEPADDAVRPIVFVSDRAGTLDLWQMDSDGGRQTPLTTLEGDEGSPEWSPDGSRVAFAGRPRGARTSDVYVVDADGSNVRQVTDTSACEDTPTWSPDAQQIVATSSVDCDDAQGTRLVVLKSDGSDDPVQIVPAPALWPDWSPNGRHLVYSGANDASDDTAIFVSDPDGTNAHPLQLPGVPSPTEPSWAPDSNRIAFVSPTGTYDQAREADWNEDVYITDVEVTSVERITTTAGNDHWPPAWSPDGAALIYTSDNLEATQGDLMSIHLESRKVTRLTDTNAQELLADWRD